MALGQLKDFAFSLVSPVLFVLLTAFISIASLIIAPLTSLYFLGRALKDFILGNEGAGESIHLAKLSAVAAPIGLILSSLTALLSIVALVITATRSVATIAHSSMNFFSKKELSEQDQYRNFPLHSRF